MLRLAAMLLLAAGVAADTPVEFAFTDPDITESSGLVVDGSSGDDLFVTTNDSGDSGRVFTIDPASGDTVGVTTWGTGSGDPVDVEALAPGGPGEVWVGDIGDNNAERDSVSVARVPVGRGDRDVSVTAYELTYPKGARDAETLLVDPEGQFLIITKGLLGGEFLRVEGPLDPDRSNPLTVIGVALPIATDGAFFADGRHLIVRSYGSAVVYAYPSLDEVGSFSLPDQEQGEGIAVDDSGAVFVSSEGEGSEVLRVPLPGEVSRAMAPPEAPSTTGSASGEADTDTDTDTDMEGSVPAPADEVTTNPSWWRWGLGGLVGLGIVLVLVRSLRPRG